MAKKKSKSILKPLILLAVSVLMLVMFFLPWMSYKSEAIGGMISDKTTVSGLDSMIALFADGMDSEMSDGAKLAYTLKIADDTAGAFKTNATCWFILALVSLATAVLSLLALFSKGKKVLFGKLFALAMLVLGVIVLVCSIVVASKTAGVDLGGALNMKASVHMASIVAAVLGLAGAGAAFALKK